LYYSYLNAEFFHWLTTWWAQAVAVGFIEEPDNLDMRALTGLAADSQARRG